MSDEREALEKHVENDAKRLEKAEKERSTLLAQTAYIGVLGLLFVLPVVGGAYLGLWLDNRAEGYSTGWFLSLMLLGIVLGAINVYLFIRE